jgi:hypothetical protein
MKEWRSFRRAMLRVRDGAPQAEVLSILGPPDAVGGEDAEAGIGFCWEYRDRLPDHVDLIIAFAGGAVRCSFTREVPDPQRRSEFRALSRPYSV